MEILIITLIIIAPIAFVAIGAGVNYHKEIGEAIKSLLSNLFKDSNSKNKSKERGDTPTNSEPDSLGKNKSDPAEKQQKTAINGKNEVAGIGPNLNKAPKPTPLAAETSQTSIPAVTTTRPADPVVQLTPLDTSPIVTTSNGKISVMKAADRFTPLAAETDLQERILRTRKNNPGKGGIAEAELEAKRFLKKTVKENDDQNKPKYQYTWIAKQ